jgi:O-antigen ligase
LNRGTFIVLAFNLFILFWKKENRKIVIGFLIVGIIGAIYYSDLLVLYFNRFFTNSGGNERFLADESALYRIEVWRVAIETIFQYPLGIGGTGFLYVWPRISVIPLLYFPTPHQILLYIGVDYGLPALFIFIILIVHIIRKTCDLCNSSVLIYKRLFFYIKLSIIGYLIHGFLTGGELSHLWGNVSPNNGFTYILMTLLAIVSYHYKILKNNNNY